MSTLYAVPTSQGAALAATSPQTPTAELKSERVQEPLAALPAEPFLVQLKSERVQEKLAAGGETEEKVTFVVELAVHQPQPVTIEMVESKVTITLHGAAVGDAGTAG